MKFYKTAWFKCVACLLILMLFSGSSITILADLLYVSPETRTSRAINKIYGEEMTYEDITVETEYDGMGKINKIYGINNGDTLFQTTGYKGYKNGTITLWIQVSVAYHVAEDGEESGETYSITKVLLETSEKQTLMSKLTGEFYGGFKLADITACYKDGNFFSATDKNAENYNPVSGATFSATAATNAVNCVIRYLGEL